MRLGLLFALWPAALGAAGSAPDPEDVLLPAEETGPGWSVVREAPEDVDADPDLRRWGVRAREARHYTRVDAGAIEVCSIEVWVFGEEAEAEAAHAGFAYPDWRIDREGRLLVMVHGMVTAPGAPPRRGVSPACGRLGERIRARASGR